jgi:hypothetical protein
MANPLFILIQPLYAEELPSIQDTGNNAANIPESLPLDISDSINNINNLFPSSQIILSSCTVENPESTTIGESISNASGKRVVTQIT